MRLINFVLLVHCDERIDAYSYFPYLNKACATQFLVESIVRLGHWNTFIDHQLRFESNYAHTKASHFQRFYNVAPFFPAKLPFRLNSCPLNLTATQWPPFIIDRNNRNEAGFEVDFILAVEQATGSQLHWTTTNQTHVELKAEIGVYRGLIRRSRSFK